MAEGKSFSGHERNSVFLNTGAGEFADISGVSGFDFLDDARSVAAADWDFDGDVDIWVYNRTGPRVRLLRNDFTSGSTNGWVSVKLAGTTCNSDAVGARVNVTAGARKLGRTLRCGEGFLSQSTKWLHFGLGDAGPVSAVTVHWPGGGEEVFSGVRAGGHFVLRQGTGQAEVWETFPAVKLRPSEQTSPAETSRSRTFLAARHPFPDLVITGADGGAIDLPDGVVLLNLWATWCLPCLEELREYSAEKTALRDAGVHVVTLNVDDPATGGDRVAAASKLLENIGGTFPFPLGFASVDVLGTLDALQRSLTQNQREMPVPMSFLIDPGGRLAAVYRGRVPVDTVIVDAELAKQPRGAWRDAATPFPGRWMSAPPVANPLRIAMKLFDRGAVEEGEKYLMKYLQANGDDPAFRSKVPDVYFAIGRFRRELGHTKEAAGAYAQALRANPRYRKAYVQLAHLLLDRGSFAEADKLLNRALRLDAKDADALTLLAMARLGQREIEDTAKYSSAALALQPNHAAAWYNLGFAHQQLGDHTGAVNAYRRVLDLSPGWAMASNNLAWLLATSPDASVRDGAEAVRIAAGICSSSGADEGGQEAIFWMTLGAAHAEQGDFESAVAAAERAAQTHAGRPRPGSSLPAMIQKQIARYLAQKPFRTR